MKLVNSIWLINFDGFFSLSEKSKTCDKILFNPSVIQCMMDKN